MNSGTRDVAQPLALKYLPQDSPQDLAQYLEDIEALTGEIQAAMEAVGADALSAFEHSVSRQQELCTRLSRLTVQLIAQQRIESFPLSGSASLSDPVLAARIRVAVELLLDLNERYAALLRHSQETVRLFTALRQSYTGPFLPFDTGAAQRPGWSFQF